VLRAGKSICVRAKTASTKRRQTGLGGKGFMEKRGGGGGGCRPEIKSLPKRPLGAVEKKENQVRGRSAKGG